MVGGDAKGREPAPANVVAGPHSGVLDTIAHHRVGMALWWRTACPVVAEAAAFLTRQPPFEHVASGLPGEATSALMAVLPSEARVLRGDIGRLAALLAARAATSVVRIRLEHATDRTCPRLHVDAVRLRLLCTYAGRGTEWQDATGTIRRLLPFHVALLKGLRWPDGEGLVSHRSPAIADLPPDERHRLLLVIDQPDLN